MELNLVYPYSENSSHWKDSFESDKELVLQYSMAGFLTSKTVSEEIKTIVPYSKEMYITGKIKYK